MFCRNCGTELKQTQKFCGSCGTKMTAAAQSPNTPANPVIAPVQDIPLEPELTFEPVLYCEAQDPAFEPVLYHETPMPWHKRAWVWAVVALVFVPASMAVLASFLRSEPVQAATIAVAEPTEASPEIEALPPVEITLREAEPAVTQHIGPEQNRVPLAEVPPPTIKPTAPVVVEEPITFDVPFVFDGLEIVCSDALRWEYIDNEFSDHHMMEVFVVPVTITNVGRETNGLNILYYSKYGPDGLELDDISFYFDTDLHTSGDIRAGATLTGDMYFLYNGDGDYYVEFENFLDKKEVRLPIEKPV